MAGLLLVAWVIAANAAPALGAQSPYAAAGISDARQIEMFLAELQRASRHGERGAVAALIQYPLTITIAGFRVPFADSAALLERYDAIFTPALQDTIARAAAAVDGAQPGQEPIDVTPEGLIIGRNALRIEPIEGELRITAIAVPRDDIGGASLASRSETGTRAARRQEPRRFGIRGGPRPTRLSGALLPGAADAYVVRVLEGQLLQVRVERGPSRAVVLRVVHAGTGTPLNSQASDAARLISGRAPEDADYRIDVLRTPAGEAAPLGYILSVSLR